MSLAGERLISIKIHCSHKKTSEVTVDFFTQGSNFFANFCLAVVSLPPLQTVWAQIRPDKMSGFVWIQTA